MALRWGKKQTIVASWIAGSACCALLLGGLALWINTTMRPLAQPLNIARNMAAVQYIDTSSAVVLTPTSGAAVGLVVYPDVHVDPAAYAYKLSGVALRGAAVVIVKTWFDYPLVDTHNIDSLKNLVVSARDKDWFVAGHGMGGERACQVASQFKGLILLGATCKNDLSKTGVSVLSITGSLDKFVTPQNATDSKRLLPGSAKFEVVDGLNHSGFGDYGLLDGDNVSTIIDSAAKQKLSDIISPFIGAKN